MSPDVLCIGHAAYDILLYLERFPIEDSKSETAVSLESGGGPAANAAYLLSQWGVRCAFAGVVGDDYYGRRILSELKSVGTDTSLIEVRPGFSTPLSLILVNQRTGSRTVVNRKVAYEPLRLELAALAGRAPRVLLFDGHEMQASRTALAAFPNAVTLLDAGSAREGTLALAGEVTYLLASERFATQVTGLPNLANPEFRATCLSILRKRFNTTTVVTLGEKGLIVHDGESYDQLPAFAALPVDTTAAGDIFHGAFAYGLLNGRPLHETLRLASMAASLSVSSLGGRQSIPPIARVEEALAHAQ